MHTRRCFCALLLLGSSLWLAYADKWDGTTDNTLDLTTSTIAINTSAQLARVAQAAQTDDFTGKTLRLTADLDLDNRAWTPIGSQAKPFAGTSSVIKASDVTTSSQLLGNTVVSGETRTLVVDISAYEYFEVCICAFDYDTLKETNENISEVTYDESAIKIIAS